MEKKFLLIWLALITSTPAVQSSTQTSLERNLSELQMIDQEIHSLEKKLEEVRKKAFNSEIQAQPYMIDNWHEFSEDIRSAEESEKEILEIKKKIEDLTERKKNALKITL